MRIPTLVLILLLCLAFAQERNEKDDKKKKRPTIQAVECETTIPWISRHTVDQYQWLKNGCKENYEAFYCANKKASYETC